MSTPYIVTADVIKQSAQKLNILLPDDLTPTLELANAIYQLSVKQKVEYHVGVDSFYSSLGIVPKVNIHDYKLLKGSDLQDLLNVMYFKVGLRPRDYANLSGIQNVEDVLVVPLRSENAPNVDGLSIIRKTKKKLSQCKIYWTDAFGEHDKYGGTTYGDSRPYGEIPYSWNDYVVCCMDIKKTLSLQSKHNAVFPYVLPLFTYYGSPDAIDHSSQKVIVWTPEITNKALHLAAKWNCPIVASRSMPEHHDIISWINDNIIKKARDWKAELKQFSIDNTPDETFKLLEAINSIAAWNAIGVTQKPAGVKTVKVGNRTVSKTSEGWIDVKTKEVMSNIIINIDEITTSMIWGTIQRGRAKDKFGIEWEKAESNPLDVLRRVCSYKGFSPPLVHPDFVPYIWYTAQLGNNVKFKVAPTESRSPFPMTSPPKWYSCGAVPAPSTEKYIATNI